MKAWIKMITFQTIDFFHSIFHLLSSSLSRWYLMIPVSQLMVKIRCKSEKEKRGKAKRKKWKDFVFFRSRRFGWFGKSVFFLISWTLASNIHENMALSHQSISYTLPTYWGVLHWNRTPDQKDKFWGFGLPKAVFRGSYLAEARYRETMHTTRKLIWFRTDWCYFDWERRGVQGQAIRNGRFFLRPLHTP